MNTFTLYSAVANNKIKLFTYKLDAIKYADQPDNIGQHVIVTYDSTGIDDIVEIEQ